MTDNQKIAGIGKTVRHFAEKGFLLLFLFFLVKGVIYLLAGIIYGIYEGLKTKRNRIIFLCVFIVSIYIGIYLIEAKQEGYYPFRNNEYWIELIMNKYGLSREQATKDYHYILKYNKYPPDFWDKQQDDEDGQDN